jgi:succinyl-diaminopimelate desuccinylase
MPEGGSPSLDDPVGLAQALVRIDSVTPDDGGAIDRVAAWLGELDAHLWHVEEPGSRVPNLVARLGRGGPRLAFAGHTDVVPPGDPGLWAYPPFAGTIEGGRLHGRGACDMKGGLACAIAAAARAERPGEIWFYVTGDEEGPARHGTAAIVRWLAARGLGFDGCIVAEPTSRAVVGDTVKVGRRGSLNAEITVHGTQGHTAFPQLADNPVHRLAAIVHELATTPLDGGTARFEPSTLQVSTFDVGNAATNVVPARARCALNIRFNTEHTAASLEAWLGEIAARHAGERAAVAITSVSDAFVAEAPGFRRCVADAVATTLGRSPRASTGGGTSDARFLKDLGPVVELGTVGHSLHRIDEWVGLDELEELTRVFAAVIATFREPA